MEDKPKTTHLGEIGLYVDVEVSWFDPVDEDEASFAGPTFETVSWESGPDDQPGEASFEDFAVLAGLTEDELQEIVEDAWDSIAERQDEERAERRGLYGGVS